ncbi:MarR family winged helix-turn-helix transcriptional regulator [Acetobacter thailandicus]|uniref:MarR family winged helix-turn-helix transcriptional regulator n=1 Tax=Acetobacter thailandicus TaxID=1502842 RepID=UPI001BA5E052|nr:MarR family transcriptional regulator [Acetobacter thailandicus]MBS0961329.1 MarR family transcriptional regulator [Acetobacter thailandicus]
MKKVYDAHFVDCVERLHTALIEILSVMNKPQQDEKLLKNTNITLDRGLFPLLVIISKFGPLSIGELADRVGRDYTTISRQTAKMETLGLITRVESKKDLRTRNSIITEFGKKIIESVDEERINLSKNIFEKWDNKEMETFISSIERFSKDLSNSSSLRTC